MGAKKKETKTKIISNERICEKHYLMELESEELGGKSVPGQFVNVLVLEEITDPFLRIPLGVHKIHKRGITLLYKVVGRATELLAKKRKGEEVSVLGPLGNGFTVNSGFGKEERTHLLVAGGHGAAPLFSLAEELLQKKQKVIVFSGASSKKCLVLEDEFKKIGCDVRIATDDGTRGARGYVTCLVEDALKKNIFGGKIEVYACGPKPMLEQLAKVVEKRGIAAQVSVDPYMACGTGICRGCAVMTKGGYKLACKDGPVFYSDQIVWGEGKGCSS